MDECEIRSGRPKGGCAILWKRSLIGKITPIESNNKRICCVHLEIDSCTILLCTVYQPCDTEHDVLNNEIYNEVLLEILNILTCENVDLIICGGDFKTDLSRSKSLHTKSLCSFVDKQHFKLGLTLN